MKGLARAVLRGQHVLVTGASSGIGLSTARRLAVDGALVTMAARGRERLEKAAASVPNAGALVLDVADKASVDRAVREHAAVFRDCDVLVNNAGLARGADVVQEGKESDWDEMLDTNVKGLLRVTRAVLPHMVARGRGHVVNIGSTAGHWVYKGGAVYCASKHAVRAITEGLRLDVHGSGVRVTSVDPGMVETEFSVVRFHGDRERAEKVYADTVPLAAEDVADAVHWAVTRPAHVNVQEIILMPTHQASVRDVHRPGRSR